MRVLLDRERLTPERIEALSDEERAGLALLRRAQAFSESLGLDRSTSYRHLIDRGDAGALRVVTAAPPDRLEPVTWWFPIVGRVDYRGYFDAARAERFAADLARDGFDTYVRTAGLYSTLGFFDDPVPRSMLGWPPFQLVDTIIHELVHETIFVASDVAYNEGLATFVAHSATLEFFADQLAEAEAARRSFADERTFAALLEQLADDLTALYAGSASGRDARERREELFKRHREEVFPSLPWQTGRYAGFANAPLSNAYVLAHRAYLGDLACFASELEALGGDLRAFIRAERDDPGRNGDC